MGYCLASLGVEAYNTQDSHGRDRFLPFNPEQLEVLHLLVLALLPVALIWWAWLRLLR